MTSKSHKRMIRIIYIKHTLLHFVTADGQSQRNVITNVIGLKTIYARSKIKFAIIISADDQERVGVKAF